MSFWESKLGVVTGNAEDAFAKQFVRIPDNTMALAKINSFVNRDNNGFKYLEIEWLITEGNHKSKKVTQKIKCIDLEPQERDPEKQERTRHRSLNMLKLIYQMFNVKPKHTGIPTDMDLAAFTGKLAGIKIRETEPNAEGKQYNWVAEVHPSQGFKCEEGVSLVAAQVVSQKTHEGNLDTAFSRNQTSELEDADVPF
jgi:hypothetical protein